MTVLQRVNPLATPGWNESIASYSDSSIFHTFQWARLLCESYGFSPHYLTLGDRVVDSALLPLMQVHTLRGTLKGVALPFSDYAQPLYAQSDTFDLFFKQVIEYALTHRWQSIEIRGGDDCLSDKPVSERFYGHRLQLTPSIEELYRALRDSTRRNIQKAQQAGVVISIERTQRSLRDFYHLNCLTRKKHGLPPQPFVFFRKLQEHIINQDLGFIVLAYIQDRPIAGGVFLTFNSKGLYKYGASDMAYQHIRANNLVMWGGIQLCKKVGCVDLSFGRTELDNDGLRQFKSGWGAQEYLIPYYMYNVKERIFSSRPLNIKGIHTRMFKNCPMPLLKVISLLLYKYQG